MGTRDQFSFGQMNCPISYTSPHCLLSYHSAVDNSFLGNGFQNYDLIYGLPPSPCSATPVLAPSPPRPPQYRAIQPRPDKHDSKAKRIDITLRSKSKKRLRSSMHRNSQQKGSGKSKPTELEADTNMVPSSTPETESSTPFSQYTDSGLRSSSQKPTPNIGLIPYAKNLDSRITDKNQSPILPCGASKASAHGRPTDLHGVHQQVIQPDNQSRWPGLSFGISQSQDLESGYTRLAAHLEKSQVLQSLSIVKDYMAKHPVIFEEQAPETVQKWLVSIESMNVSRSWSEEM